MPPLSDWRIAPERQPEPDSYAFDLERTLSSVVAVKTVVPDDAFTAETLGTRRGGNGVVIDDGVVLTIGYLITEAEEVWIGRADGTVVAGHPLAYDQPTGFGLVRALGSLGLPALPLGRSDMAVTGTPVIMAGAGGRRHSIAARVVARQEFAGYWEYLLDDAIFTAPSHPLWGGSALIGPTGELIGIGSLQVEQREEGDEASDGSLNMAVPTDLLKPILPAMLTTGSGGAPRPWLGLFATDVDGRVVVVGVYSNAPSDTAGVRPGDVILSAAGESVSSLAQLFRRVWAMGPVGTTVTLVVHREGETLDIKITTSARDEFLKRPRLHS